MRSGKCRHAARRGFASRRGDAAGEVRASSATPVERIQRRCRIEKYRAVDGACGAAAARSRGADESRRAGIRARSQPWRAGGIDGGSMAARRRMELRKSDVTTHSKNRKLSP